MIASEERERLLKLQQEAFGEWYKLRSELERFEMLKEHSSIDEARRAAEQAYNKLRDCMDALLSHDCQHEGHKHR